MLCMHDLGTALGAYRMCLALSLARQAGPFFALAEPVLTAFPGILQVGRSCCISWCIFCLMIVTAFAYASMLQDEHMALCKLRLSAC